ncbi:restriction endonuclease [Kiritimatiellaeota bacterium B1221]|nr:restriction endonuclease [Kiritimatiellaeota bacterium B1221]
MPLLNFQEIPSAKATKQSLGSQDTFELFAEEVLELVGFEIISSPGRGADGGKDLVVREIRKGVGGQSTIEWLVSCKHFAHSGESVSPEHEQNIVDRVEQHNCDGFFGFYSTLPSSGLQSRLDQLVNIETLVYSREKIERRLLDSEEGRLIASRYFPNSIRKINEPTELARLFVERSGACLDKTQKLADVLCGGNPENGFNNLIAALPCSSDLNAGTGAQLYDLSPSRHDAALINGPMWCENGIKIPDSSGFIDLGQRLPLRPFSMVVLFVPEQREDGARQALIMSASYELAFGVYWSLGKLLVISHIGNRVVSETDVSWQSGQLQILLIRGDGFRRLWISSLDKWSLMAHRFESIYFRSLGQRECMMPHMFGGPNIATYDSQRIESWNGMLCGVFIWNKMLRPRIGKRIMSSIFSFWQENHILLSEQDRESKVLPPMLHD